MRRLGIDYGARRIGLAIAEEGTSVALPHRTLESPGAASAVGLVVEAMADLDIAEVIVGLPLRLDGTRGESARRAVRFAEGLGERIEAPVVLWDERLSTRQAEVQLDQRGLSGRDKRRVIDQAAAAVILQSYLDARTEETCTNSSSPPPHPPAPSRKRRGRGGRGR